MNQMDASSPNRHRAPESSYNEAGVPEWPPGIEEITYHTSADGSQQPAMFYDSGGSHTKPLLVGLHSWSHGCQEAFNAPLGQWCIRNDWVFIYPHFRGAGNRPQAAGSDLVIADITSAVEHAADVAHVDTSRIYLVGASGGGHAALLLAGRRHDIWTAVSAWVPITDLKAWYGECVARGLPYAAQIANACGGVPVEGSEAAAECTRRSPLTWLPDAKGLPVDISAGIHDGHEGSVPVSHSLRAFNGLAASEDRVSEEAIAHIVEKAEVPAHLRDEADDPTYGSRKVLFRRRSRNVRVTLFDGGHTIVFPAALKWLDQQRKGGPSPL